MISKQAVKDAVEGAEKVFYEAGSPIDIFLSLAQTYLSGELVEKSKQFTPATEEEIKNILCNSHLYKLAMARLIDIGSDIQDTSFFDILVSALVGKVAQPLATEEEIGQVLEKMAEIANILKEYGYESERPIGEVVSALVGKVAHPLATEEEIANTISKVMFGESLNEDKPVRNLEIYCLAKALVGRVGRP